MPDYFNSLLTGHVLNVYIPIHSIMCLVLTLRTELSTYFILANFVLLLFCWVNWSIIILTCLQILGVLQLKCR